jgi:hypothetical protein
MDWLGAGHAEDTCLSAAEPGSEDMKQAPVLFSVTVIVHDGSRARQMPEGHRTSLDVRLGCYLACERRRVATGEVLFALHQQRFDVAQAFH